MRNALFNSLLICAERRPPRRERLTTLLPPPPPDDHLRASFERCLIEEGLTVNSTFTLQLREGSSRKAKPKRRRAETRPAAPRGNHNHRLRSSTQPEDVIRPPTARVARIDEEDAIQISRKSDCRSARPITLSPPPCQPPVTTVISISSDSDPESNLGPYCERYTGPLNPVENEREAAVKKERTPSRIVRKRQRSRTIPSRDLSTPRPEEGPGLVPRPIDPTADHGSERSPRSTRISKTVAPPVKRFADSAGRQFVESRFERDTAPQRGVEAFSFASDPGMRKMCSNTRTESKDTRVLSEETFQESNSARSTGAQKSHGTVDREKSLRETPPLENLPLIDSLSRTGKESAGFQWSTSVTLRTQPLQPYVTVGRSTASRSVSPHTASLLQVVPKRKLNEFREEVDSEDEPIAKWQKIAKVTSEADDLQTAGLLVRCPESRECLEGELRTDAATSLRRSPRNKRLSAGSAYIRDDWERKTAVSSLESRSAEKPPLQEKMRAAEVGWSASQKVIADGRAGSNRGQQPRPDSKLKLKSLSPARVRKRKVKAPRQASQSVSQPLPFAVKQGQDIDLSETVRSLQHLHPRLASSPAPSPFSLITPSSPPLPIYRSPNSLPRPLQTPLHRHSSKVGMFSTGLHNPCNRFLVPQRSAKLALASVSRSFPRNIREPVSRQMKAGGSKFCGPRELDTIKDFQSTIKMNGRVECFDSVQSKLQSVKVKLPLSANAIVKFPVLNGISSVPRSDKSTALSSVNVPVRIRIREHQARSSLQKFFPLQSDGIRAFSPGAIRKSRRSCECPLCSPTEHRLGQHSHDDGPCFLSNPCSSSRLSKNGASSLPVIHTSRGFHERQSSLGNQLHAQPEPRVSRASLSERHASPRLPISTPPPVLSHSSSHLNEARSRSMLESREPPRSHMLGESFLPNSTSSPQVCAGYAVPPLEPCTLPRSDKHHVSTQLNQNQSFKVKPSCNGPPATDVVDTATQYSLQAGSRERSGLIEWMAEDKRRKELQEKFRSCNFVNDENSQMPSRSGLIVSSGGAGTTNTFRAGSVTTLPTSSRQSLRRWPGLNIRASAKLWDDQDPNAGKSSEPSRNLEATFGQRRRVESKSPEPAHQSISGVGSHVDVTSVSLKSRNDMVKNSWNSYSSQAKMRKQEIVKPFLSPRRSLRLSPAPVGNLGNMMEAQTRYEDIKWPINVNTRKIEHEDDSDFLYISARSSKVATDILDSTVGQERKLSDIAKKNGGCLDSHHEGFNSKRHKSSCQPTILGGAREMKLPNSDNDSLPLISILESARDYPLSSISGGEPDKTHASGI